MPTEKQREYKRLLKELDAKVGAMKEKDEQKTAFLQRDIQRAEEEYQQKMAELAGPIFEDLAKGAVDNAETVTEEEQEEEH